MFLGICWALLALCQLFIGVNISCGEFVCQIYCLKETAVGSTVPRNELKIPLEFFFFCKGRVALETLSFFLKTTVSFHGKTKKS